MEVEKSLTLKWFAAFPQAQILNACKGSQSVHQDQ